MAFNFFYCFYRNTILNSEEKRTNPRHLFFPFTGNSSPKSDDPTDHTKLLTGSPRTSILANDLTLRVKTAFWMIYLRFCYKTRTLSGYKSPRKLATSQMNNLLTLKRCLLDLVRITSLFVPMGLLF